MNDWLPPKKTPPFFGADRGTADRFTRAWRDVDVAAYEGAIVGERVGAWVERHVARTVTAVARIVGVRVVRWMRGAP